MRLELDRMVCDPQDYHRVRKSLRVIFICKGTFTFLLDNGQIGATASSLRGRVWLYTIPNNVTLQHIPPL